MVTDGSGFREVPMSLWMVRAGRHGEQEQAALEHNLVTIGWNEVPDLTQFQTREEFQEHYEQLYPGKSKMQVATQVGQIWRFANEIQKGDLVALPLKTQSAIALGEVTGDYKHRMVGDDIVHTRPVKWLQTLPRSAFDQDILYSLGAFMTVCKIERNRAEDRIRRLLKKGVSKTGPQDGVLQEIMAAEQEVDIEEIARDQIVKYIPTKFKGHGLARLVEAIFQARGYTTRRSRPGRDGGVDILAAPGPMGFGQPRLCIQVKSSQGKADVSVCRELQGVMTRVNAQQGLLVSWGGFTDSATKEVRDSFFKIRLWDQGALLDEISENYESFDDKLKAELHLKRIWGLVQESEH